MWKSKIVLRIANYKSFSRFIGGILLCIVSGYSNAIESTSTCWVFQNSLGNVHLDTATVFELGQQSWPDPGTALSTFAQLAANRILGFPCLTGSGRFKGTVSQIEEGVVYPSHFTSGPVGDPRTGIPIGYRQVFGFLNESGEWCMSGPTSTLYADLETWDGTHFGRSQCQQKYSIKLSPLSSTAESGTTLTSIEPSKATGSLVAKVYDQNGQLVPNAKVKLELTVDAESGGHHQHGGDRPKGTLSSGSMTGEALTGSTGTSGFAFTFKAPAPAGDHKITASCTDGKSCTPQGPDTVWVGHKGLQPLGDTAVYRLIPNATKDPGHPDNHYLTLTAASRLTVLATLYRAKYPDLAVLHLNDASLERGGIFDLSHNWKSPHFEHCRGAVIDVRANGAEGALDITSQTDPMIKKFQELTSITGASALWDIPKDKNNKRRWELRHFHIQLMGQEGLQCP